MADVSLFKNGYGVSIICHEHSYGLELAVLEWEGTWNEEKDAPEEVKTCNITYNTPITDDVVGHLNADTLKETVDKVKALEGEL